MEKNMRYSVNNCEKDGLNPKIKVIDHKIKLDSKCFEQYSFFLRNPPFILNNLNLIFCKIDLDILKKLVQSLLNPTSSKLKIFLKKY